MKDEKVYFNLEQVAEICGQSVESIKCKIFKDNFLVPSYSIKMPIRAALYIELQGESGRKFHFLFGVRDLRMIPKRIKQPLSPYVSTIEKAQFFDSINTERRRQQNPFNTDFTGIVDIFNINGNRHSGEFDGNIELHPEFRRKIISSSGLEDFLTRPRLSYSTQSGLRIELHLLERCEFSEDELIIRREYLINAISHNITAMQRLKHLDERLSLSPGAPGPELPPDELKKTPQEYWEQLQQSEKDKSIRAALLRRKFSVKALSNHEAMRLFDPDRVSKWEDDKKAGKAMGRPKGLFAYWAIKGEKLLHERENMSSS